MKEDLRPFVKFVGYNQIGEEPRALIYNQADDTSSLLAPGDGFDMADVRGTVRVVGRRTLTVERNDRLFELELGQSLAQAKDVGPVEPPADTPAAELEGETDPAEVPGDAAAG